MITLILIQLLAVISPWPDMAMIIQQSLLHGRISSYYSALGLGIWIIVHCMYSIIGISSILNLYPQIIPLIQICGAWYLLYLWYSGLITIHTSPAVRHHDVWLPVLPQTAWQWFRKWLYTNLLNPKVTLFIVTLYGSISLSVHMQILLAVIMAINTSVRFVIVWSILTVPRVQNRFVAVLPLITYWLSMGMIGLSWWIISQQITTLYHLLMLT